MGIRLADTLEPMADFPSAYAKDIAFDDGDTLQEKLDTGSLGGGGVGYTQLSQAEYDALTEDEKLDGREYRTYDTGHIYKLGVEYGKEDAIYTTLGELGLTAPVTVGDIFNAMPTKSMAVIACEGIEGDTSGADVHVSDVPVSFGVLTIKKNQHSRFSIEYQNSLAGAPCNVRRWVGTLKGNDGTGLYWREVAYKENLSIYKSLSELGLDTTATLKDITRAMAKSSMIAIKVDAMANQSEYNNITQGTVTIYKIEDARIQAIMTNKVDGRTWVATLGGENTIIGWKELRSDSPFYRIVTQGIAGYFKFKPTSNGIDQPLRISVTDNYGGMINISGAKPTASQYKPFKCIRLSNGEYTNYDAMKVANNKMLKLFYYDGYFYLKVTTYTTCTFTGLIEAPTYVETFDEKVAEEIPMRSVFDTPYNDGYADPSIIVIGDTASSDGVIKTLNSLGFTGDVMTWDTGVYRLSHVGGLTNLPAEITEEKPGLRIEHYDMKKWGSNHNPYVSTYGCRQSVLHYKGDVYVRYTESGATAGVLITDTGWINISNKKPIKFNSKTFKIDITKGNENWNGNMKFGYCIDESYGEIIISSLGKTEVMWDHSTGVRYVKSVTYTIDPNNKAHITIGIELYDVSYGIHQLEIIGDFARVNSITGDAFTGTSVAKRGATRGRNNGVGILCNVEDLGLTTPCTTVQIAQAMRNLANKMTRIPASGMIGIFEGDKSLITDAPSQYGLLQINAYGYDRVMIRYDGIGGSTYAGSWIGKVKGSGGTFSEVTWERIDNIYSTGETAIGTWIDGSTIYRKVISISNIDAKTSTSTVILGDAPVSEQNMLKIEGFVNLIGNQYFIHYPNIASDNDSINATLNIANGYFKLTGTWKYPINKGAIIIEYLKS